MTRVAPRGPDTVVFQSPLVTIGKFRCATDDPMFRDSGPIAQSCMVFPRSAVVIQHEHRRAFVADPAIATLYNRGQRYERRPISPEGDRCDWFALDDDLVRDIVRTVDSASADQPDAAIRHARVAVRHREYLEQRRLFARASAAAPAAPVDAFDVEERVVVLFARMIRRASGSVESHSPKPKAGIARAARAFIARNFARKIGLSEIARAVGSSPFHLCRAFRQAEGSTLHAHLTTLRLRWALERLDESADLTRIALDAGFSSHSHFSAAFHRAFGVPPSRIRRPVSRSVSTAARAGF